MFMAKYVTEPGKGSHQKFNVSAKRTLLSFISRLPYPSKRKLTVQLKMNFWRGP